MTADRTVPGSADRSRLAVGCWLLVATLTQAAGVIAVDLIFAHTARGQVVEQAPLTGNQIGHDHVIGYVSSVLDVVSGASLAVATLIVGFIALFRRRFALATVAILLIVGANLSTQILKQLILDRPDLGVLERIGYGNSFPSGHATVAMSVAAALVLVVPRQLRSVTAVVGAGYAAAVGVATISAGWHRPSDALGAYLLVGAWTSLAGLVLLGLQRRDEVGGGREAHPIAVAVLLAGGLCLLAVGGIALALTLNALAPDTTGSAVDALGPRRLFLAYAGSGAGIAGTCLTVMAALLASVHRIVPGRLRTVTGRRIPVALPTRG